MNMHTEAYEFQEHMPLILNREELEKLREEDPQLYAHVASIYLDFLQEKLG